MNVLYDNKDNTFNDITKDCKLKYQINMYFEGIISGLISLYNILHIFKITHNIKVLFLSDNDEIIAVISEDNITTIN